MTKVHRTPFTGIGLLVMLAASPLLGEDFYEGQLRSAKISIAASRPSDAADELRIASFGFLDRPQLLSESLVRLALAQAEINSSELARTLDRFLEVEGRFGVYATASLEANVRASFENLLRSKIGVDRLTAIPTLAAVGAAPEPAPKTRRGKKKPQPVPTEKAVTEESAPAAAAEVRGVPRGKAPSSAAPVRKPAEPAPAATAPTVTPEAAAKEGARLMQSGRPGDAAKVLYAAVQSNPARRDLRLSLLEASTLFADWRTAAAQVPLLVPFAAGEELYAFYAAVVYYETGNVAEAKRLVASSVDKIPQRAYVKYYAAKIRDSK